MVVAMWPHYLDRIHTNSFGWHSRWGRFVGSGPRSDRTSWLYNSIGRFRGRAFARCNGMAGGGAFAADAVGRVGEFLGDLTIVVGRHDG